MKRLSRCLWASLLLLYLFGALSSLNARPNSTFELRPGVVKGSVYDEATNTPIPFASIVIKTSDGEKTITGGISDDEGKFKICLLYTSDDADD